ncbi:MAG: iron uptake porin [Coleofasciculus sp. D1-CHI-01]|uniref:iron uptake porin n=1 Tax=Coleofasciculus sp. D1-CHI-01 TaxID=3068482 RepID=UPI0032FC1E21
MNQHHLRFWGKIGLLCLIAGAIPWDANLAIAKTTELEFRVPEEATHPLNNLHVGLSDRTPLSATPLKQTGTTDQPTHLQIAQEVENNNSTVTSVSDMLERLDSESSPMGQVTSVSQLSDVSPGDWAYEALRSLVERYGCIAGYPDGTFRGNRALTRYEFAAGLNACLQQIERLIVGTEVDDTELVTLRRLIEEFEAELATLGARVDNLEGRVAFLEDHQFSTTTKLNGEVIFSLVGATSDEEDANIILADRVRLNLNTSFTGQDLLITGLQAYNFGGDITGAGSVQGALFPGRDAFLSEGSTKLSFEPQFPEFNPQDLSDSAGSNDVELYKLLYIFPSGVNNLTLFAGTAAEASDAFPAIIPFSSEGQGAISRFATLNPVLRVSGGTSQTGLASAAGFIWGISDAIDLRALYGSVNAAIPEQGGNNILGSGFFGGSTVASAQLTLKPSSQFDIGLNYAYSYHDLNIMGLGLTRFSSNPLNIPGRTVDGDGNPIVGGILDTPVHVNSLGATATWRISPKISLTGYGAYFFVDAVAGADASSDFTTWMAGLHFQDLFKEGNTAGLIFGQPLHRVEADGEANLTEPGVDRETPYHLEAFYNFKVSDNVSITPGAFVLFNPESDGNNDTALVGVLRTTFTF